VLRSFKVFALSADALDVQDLFNLHRHLIRDTGAS
jgi:hypothetical protein